MGQLLKQLVFFESILFYKAAASLCVRACVRACVSTPAYYHYPPQNTIEARPTDQDPSIDRHCSPCSTDVAWATVADCSFYIL